MASYNACKSRHEVLLDVIEQEIEEIDEQIYELKKKRIELVWQTIPITSLMEQRGQQ